MKNNELNSSTNADIRNVVINLDQQVWSHPAFPNRHRPDINGLMDQIYFIDQIPFRPEQVHPHLKTEWLNQKKQAQIMELNSYSSKVGMYFPDTREIFLSTQLLREPLRIIERVLSHELSTDTLERESHIFPHQYTNEQSLAVQNALHQLFHRNRLPLIEDTRIRKGGFRLVVEVDNYYVADLYPPVPEVSEVYPTMFEIITDQALNHRITRLDSLSRDRISPITPYEDHPHFAASFFSITQNLNWKRLLDAFHSSAPEGILEQLKAITLDPPQALHVYTQLVSSLAKDEKNIKTMVSKNKSSIKFNLPKKLG